MSFTYNDEGLRTSKTVNGVKTTYYYSGTKLIAEVTPSSVLVYLYDADGTPLGMKYLDTTDSNNEWEIYWFEKNLQGDIVAVYSEAGLKLLSYRYNAWGEIVSTSYSNDGSSTNAVKNSLRYRGYYFDTDLGLYYLQSRYYDARTCRFINADSLMSGANGSLHGFNLFVYCFNNPINMTDGQGEWPRWVEDAWNWVVDTATDIGDWVSDNIGVGVVQSQTYDTISASNLYGDFESGYGSSYVIAGDISKPVSFYVTNASEWWKLWEYKLGVQINTDNGGVALAGGLGENSIIVANGCKSTEFTCGLNKVSITNCRGVDFGNRTAETYEQLYIRTPTVSAVAIAAYLTYGAATSLYMIPVFA